VVKDWCFRCRVMLAEQSGRLVLKVGVWVWGGVWGAGG
jgi:hypothetical protein